MRAAIPIRPLVSFQILLLFLQPTALVLGEPVVDLQKELYTVEGETASMLRNSLNTRSPVRINGNRYDAYTEWHVSWHYSYMNKEDNCKLYDISTAVTIHQTLPKIERIPETLKNRWDHYYKALLSHENHHREFALQAAREVEESLNSLPGYEDCRELTLKADRLGEKIVRKYVSIEQQYDQKTDYGALEGVRFP